MAESLILSIFGLEYVALHEEVGVSNFLFL